MWMIRNTISPQCKCKAFVLLSAETDKVSKEVSIRKRKDKCMRNTGNQIGFFAKSVYAIGNSTGINHTEMR